jgi:hypothetical protein
MAAANDHTKGHVMTSSNQKKFLVLYLVPASVMEEWSKTDPNDKKAAEEKMRSEWDNWMSTHSKMIISTDAGGGVSDTKNDIVLCSIVEAESHEAAAKSFENHPHLQIPQSSIEVMEIRPIGGM